LLQFEAVWVLTNIAAGTSEQIQPIVDHGAVPLLVSLLSSSNPDVREQAVWALGNIAGDGAPFRDCVLRAGVMEPLLNVVQSETQRTTLIQNAVWTLSNLCKGENPPPDWEIVCTPTPHM